MKIKELGIDERPIEKLLEKGADTLSNAELIAILLKSGTESLNALDVARLLLGASEGSLTKLSSTSVEKMREIPGIGQKKAATISAAFELGRRFAFEGSCLDKTAITGPGMVFSIMIPRFKGLQHEECWILYLNRANYIISKEMLSSGGLSSTTFDIGMVVVRAIEKKASAIILVHNHPSGNPRPGNSDLSQTKAVKDALAPMDISLMDHIIICDDGYFSFADEKRVIVD